MFLKTVSSPASIALFSFQACSLRKLFAVEEEFEDEDFLSAVEDAENHFTGVLPGNAGRLRPVSSRPQETVQEQSSKPLPLHRTAPSALGLRLPTPIIPQTIRDLPSAGAASLRPVSFSSSWTGSWQRKTLTEVCQEPAGPQSSVPYSGLIFESHQQGTGGIEVPEQDEFDKALAGMELEGTGMELGLGVDSRTTQILPAQQQEDPVSVKKARVADLSGSFQKGPITLRPRLRPGSSGLLVPATSAFPTQQFHWEVSPRNGPVRKPQPRQTTGGSPRNRLPGQPLQSPSAWLSGKPCFPGPGTPSCNSVVFPQGSLQSQAPVSSVDSPVSTPKGPHSTLVPQGALQTPIVTNHLLQLVTAASRTPQQPIRPSIRAKTRRFPGPAGLLPHQVDLLMQTPLFWFQVIASSQGSVEEDFGRGPWLTMKSALGLDERDPTCFLYTYSIVMVLRKAALKQLPRNKVPNMAVMIKSLTRSTMDASVVFKDPTGEMLGTVHRMLLETCQNELKPGSVLLLKQIGVFSPSLRNHYLNVTPKNLVHIYSPDSGDGNFLKSSQPLPKDPGSFFGSHQSDVDTEPTQGLRTEQNPEDGVSLEEELPEGDDLDGLLSELPEDFFCEPSS
uniref:Homologous recombination factor with OB-fold n=1 Tax=Nannospalax galili TaxID=1026970 RepID=A0A8C6QD37_NANGA